MAAGRGAAGLPREGARRPDCASGAVRGRAARQDRSHGQGPAARRSPGDGGGRPLSLGRLCQPGRSPASRRRAPGPTHALVGAGKRHRHGTPGPRAGAGGAEEGRRGAARGGRAGPGGAPATLRRRQGRSDRPRPAGDAEPGGGPARVPCGGVGRDPDAAGEGARRGARGGRRTRLSRRRLGRRAGDVEDGPGERAHRRRCGPGRGGARP